MASEREQRHHPQFVQHEPLNYKEQLFEYDNDSQKGPPQACLFVASISDDTSEEMLKEFFSDYGQLLNVKLLKDRSSRPYAFVQFSSPEESDHALEQTKGKTLNDRRLRVEKAKVNRTLFLAKLSKQLASNELRGIVEEYGPVESVTIIKNHQTNQSKGCGFVKFIYREDALEAFAGLKTKRRNWVVEWATSTNDPDLLGVDKLNIFIGGLNPHKVGKDVLEEKFKSYGEIESITLINKALDQQPTDDSDENGAHQRSAFAFIRYKDKAHSASAIEKENGAEWLDRRIRVQYCESQEMKNKRRANKFLQLQYNSPFYSGMQIPPMMYMGGMPMGSEMGLGGMPMSMSYVSPPNMANNIPKFMPPSEMPNNPYNGGPPFSYPMFYNHGGPWLYAPQPQMYPSSADISPPPVEGGQYYPSQMDQLNNTISHLSLDELTLSN